MKYLSKSYVTTSILMLLVSSTKQAGAVHLDDMFESMMTRMEQQFGEAFKRMDDQLDAVKSQSTRFETYAHNATVNEDETSVRVAVTIDKDVKAEDVMIDVDNGNLHLLIEKPERLEIFVEERWLTLSAERRAGKDGASSVSYASQQLTLPAVVDVSTVDADLTDGVLTLTFKKNVEKNPRHVTVKQGQLKGGEKSKSTAPSAVAAK